MISKKIINQLKKEFTREELFKFFDSGAYWRAFELADKVGGIETDNSNWNNGLTSFAPTSWYKFEDDSELMIYYSGIHAFNNNGKELIAI